MNDKKGVTLALVATFLVLVADEIAEKNRAPKPRRVIAFAVVFLVLGFLAEIPSTAKLSKYFATLVFIGTLYTIGPDLWPKLSGRLRGTIKVPASVSSKQLVPVKGGRI